MSYEHRIDDLIEAARGVLESDFDPGAFQRWRRRAFDCLTAVVGPDHVYTRHFANFVRQAGKTDLISAGDILSAGQEQMDGNKPAKANGNLKSVSPFAKETRGAIRPREFLQRR